MATPTKKSPAIDAFLDELTRTSGRTRREAIEADVCLPAPIGCGGPADEFDDALSETEYRISGLCQTCQNAVFVDCNEE